MLSQTSLRPAHLGLGAGLLLSIPALSLPAAAQIRFEAPPAAFFAELPSELVPIDFVEPPDVELYLAEDEINGHRPLRYGALLPVDIGLDQGGVHELLADGTHVWRFRIYSPGAFSIGLEFDQFVLPEGAYCSMYDEQLTTVYGAYGAINNQPDQQLQFEPFPGDTVIFEYVQPPQAVGQAQLHLGTVIYDYRNVDSITLGELESLSGSGDGCGLIDVNCPEGDPWALQKRAVVRTLSGGGLCSGALINNTSNDGTGYVLTANHCGQGTTTNFRFNYQTANCGSGSAPTSQSVSGNAVLTSTSTFDSRLLRINNAIPSNYNPYWAGWSRSTTNSTLAFSMGHPEGGPKKISIDNSGATKSSLSSDPNSAWFVNWNSGFLLGGSSGGPLFDQNGRVIGPACCVSSFTCSTQTAWYGRFDRFYNSNNLAQWLDPAGTNPTTLDGFGSGSGGGGGGNPDITSIAPLSITAVNANSPVTVTLTGTGFTGLTDLTIDGVSISTFPPQFTVVNDTTVAITLTPPFNIGTKSIVVVEGAQSDSVNLPVTFNLTPTIDLINSDPSFLITLAPLEVYMGGLPNDLHFLLVSGSNLPTVVPGIFSAGIGNNLTNLFLVNSFVVSPITGSAKAELPVTGLPIGTKIYFQSGSISALFPALPLTMSNVESGTVLF
jgi:hypothetical protein